MLRKVGQNYQIAIPREIVAELGLKIEDYIEVRVEQGKIVLEPQVLVPRGQAYFYTDEWQKGERKAGADIRKGRVTKTKSLRDLFKKLDS